MMQLGHVFAGQLAMYLSLLAVVLAAESRAATRWTEHIAALSFLRVSDAKGVFFLLFSASTAAVGFLLETMRSVAKMGRNERAKYRIIKAQRSFTYMSLVLLANFLGTYIFRALAARTMNLLLLALCSHLCCVLSALLGLGMVNVFFYLTFALANLAVLLLTHLIGFEALFAGAGMYVRRFRPLNAL